MHGSEVSLHLSCRHVLSRRYAIGSQDICDTGVLAIEGAGTVRCQLYDTVLKFRPSNPAELPFFSPGRTWRGVLVSIAVDRRKLQYRAQLHRRAIVK